MSYGAQIKYGLARQTAGGTAVTAPTSYFGFAQVSEDVGLEKDELISQNLIGRFEEGAVYDGINRVLGTIEFELTPKNLNVALAAAVTHLPAVVTSGSVKTLTFLPNTQDFDSTYVKSPWSVYKQFTDATSAEQFYDCQPGQLELTVSQGQFGKGRLTINGGARSANGVGSMNVVPDAADVGILYPWNVSSISIGGSGVGQNSEITVTLNENIEALYTNNASLAPFKYSRSVFRQVTVNGTFYMTDRSTLNDFVAGTKRRLLVTLMNTLTAIQSGYFNSLTIDVPQMKITAFKPAAGGPGEVAVSFQARGVIDPTSFYSIQFTSTSTLGGTF